MKLKIILTIVFSIATIYMQPAIAGEGESNLCVNLEEKINAEEVSNVFDGVYAKVFNKKIRIPEEFILVSYNDSYAQFIRYWDRYDKKGAIRIGKLNSESDITDYIKKNSDRICDRIVIGYYVEIEKDLIGDDGIYYNVRIFNENEYVDINSTSLDISSKLIAAWHVDN